MSNGKLRNERKIKKRRGKELYVHSIWIRGLVLSLRNGVICSKPVYFTFENFQFSHIQNTINNDNIS
jgi:hypothetical protein